MRISAKPLAALRLWFIVAFVVFWNAALLLAKWIDDQSGADGLGRWLMIATLGVTALLAVAIMVSERVRKWLLDPLRRDLYDPEPFVLIAIVTGFMAVFFGFWF
jgi:type VI protein secretion system component VasK